MVSLILSDFGVSFEEDVEGNLRDEVCQDLVKALSSVSGSRHGHCSYHGSALHAL